MKIELEIRSFVSRRQLRELLSIAVESTGRLAHRMTDEDLARIEAGAQMIAGLIAAEKRRRTIPLIDAHAAGDYVIRREIQ